MNVNRRLGEHRRLVSRDSLVGVGLLGLYLGLLEAFYKKDVHDQVFKEGTIIGYIISLSACSTLNTIQGLNPGRFLDQELHGRSCSEISVSLG